MSSPAASRPRRRGRPRLHPLAVAAVVIGAAAALTYYAFERSLPFGHRFTVYALVSNSVNVRSGDPVRIDGVNVGQVTGVSRQGNGARIALTLQAQALPVHRDATIRIRDRLFLEGSYYLELDPGTAGAPNLRGGATIPRSQTSTPVQLYQVLSVFDSATRSGLTGALEALAQGLGSASGGSRQTSGAAGLKHAAPHLAPIFSDTAVISHALRGSSPRDLPKLLSAGAAVTRTLSQSSSQLAGLVRGLYRTSSALASADGRLAQTLSGLDNTLRAAPPALSAVDRALPPVRRLSQALNPSLLAAPPLLDRLTPVVRQLASVLSGGSRRALLGALTATFEELPTVLDQLARAFPVGKQITDCLRTHVLGVLLQKAPDGALSTNRPVLQDFLHFLPSLAGASGSFDGDGPYTRFLAAAGSNSLSGVSAGQQLFSTAPPGSNSLQGARPQWVGDLTAGDFRPDAPCTSQPLPNLAAATAPPDFMPSAP